MIQLHMVILAMRTSDQLLLGSLLVLWGFILVVRESLIIIEPLFPKMTVQLENGNKLVVEAEKSNQENVYIWSAALNGKAFTINYLLYEELMGGGVIRYVMTDQLKTNRGIEEIGRLFLGQRN